MELTEEEHRFRYPYTLPPEIIVHHYTGQIPDSSARWIWTAFSAGAVLRGAVGRRLYWTVGGGFGGVSASGTVGSFGQWVEGAAAWSKHAEAFVANWQESLTGCVEVRGDLVYRLAPRVALTGGVHYARASAGHGRWATYLGEAMPPPAAIDPSYLRAGLSLQYTVWRKKAVDVIEGWREK